MKQLLTIGTAQGLSSFMPILMWLLVGVVKYISISKLHFNIFKGALLRPRSIISNITMLIIYSVGLGRVTSMFPWTLVTYNVFSFCTDTQWDMLEEGIDTYSSIEICNKHYDKSHKTLIKNCILYSLLLVASSIVLLVICYPIYTYDIRYMVIMFLFKYITLPIDAIGTLADNWINLEGNNRSLTVCYIIGHIVRLVISLAYVSPYTLSLATGICSALICNMSAIVIYKRQRKKVLSNGYTEEA